MSALPASVERALHAELRAGRSLAWLHVDSTLRLAGCGGFLAHYGLDAVRIGEPASQQAAFLEGFLPLVESPMLIRSVELVGGCAADLHFRAHAGHTWVVLLDVTAERDEARQVQQKAYEMTLLEEKEAQLNRRLEAANAALIRAQGEIEASRAALQRVHDRLSLELKEAATYVRSILPAPMRSPFDIDWRFVPSAALGGDCFGYHWIDDEHFSMYLLDVCGHGIGPSLMSVGVLNTLRSGSLPEVDLRDPAQVMAGLNRIYRMQAHNDLFFTIWYGVYTPATRRLDYAAAGHPPALLVQLESASRDRNADACSGAPSGATSDGSSGDSCTGAVHASRAPRAGATPTRMLGMRSRPIGTVADDTWCADSVTVPRRSLLYLLSDGAFEVFRSDGSMLPFDEFVDFIGSLDTAADDDDEAPLDRLLDYLHAQGRGSEGDDDLSIVRFGF